MRGLVFAVRGREVEVGDRLGVEVGLGRMEGAGGSFFEGRELGVRLWEGERLSFGVLQKVHTVDPFHRKEELASLVIRDKVVKRDEIGMGEIGEGSKLAFEFRKSLRIGGLEHLERDERL